MSEPVELTEAERDDLYDTWMFNYEWANLIAAIEGIVAAREATARREALLEAAEHFTARANAAHRDDLHMVSWDMAASDLRALAEPERDEEGGND